jgi:glycosyltransferase involved in cell wall biosynthesis
MAIITLLLPCLNEAATIKKAVLKVLSTGQKYFPGQFEVIVADNGSTDSTLKVLKQFSNIRVINVPVRGYGAALHWGILSAKGQYVLFADADLSYDFAEIKKFLPYLKQGCDLVLGSRLRGRIQKGAMPWLNRYFGTPLLTFLIRLLYRLPVSDCNSGMRLIKKSFYQKLKMTNAGMEWASALLIKTALHHGHYAEVPITFSPDQRCRPSHLLRWVDGWRHLKAIILLKPNSLLWLIGLFFFLALLFYPFYFSLFFFFALLTESLFLFLLAAKMLHYVIDGVNGGLVNLMLKLPLIPLTILANLLLFSQLLFWSTLDSRFVFLLVSNLMILNMWLFLTETIKTHLFNRLPDRI